ncbi:GNAT family N-acetyltransferase [Ulvibacter litoralis]|uniref:Ribosomal-protein-serine acetyltransferase n=1 Tax=Ulvibacter litoralis TaxID=227084 RepID=A0A1G7IJ27_9FLAO|nr:GNAT family protein [Ulvibacter litoralis]GHC60942.1 50S ribosomal protein L7 serine acetyltransferase [Ulvibacter litoralis]SDF12534.1 ribosomal-protein-serine acetyltransferase [Ulvibacter litoralis]
MNLKVDVFIELRELKVSDSTEIYRTIDSQRKYLGEWLPFVEKTKSSSDTEAFVKSVIDTPSQNKEFTFTIRKQNEFVGLIGLRPTDRLNKKTEIGYWLSEKHQKQGIVIKSVQRLCDFAFNELDLNRVSIKCAVNNEPSKSIPKNLGFKFEGIEREAELVSENVFRDLEVYSKLKKDY